MEINPVESAFDEFCEIWFSGERMDPAAFCQSHPECGPELRERIDSFLLVNQKLSKAGKDESTGADSSVIEKIVGDFRILGEIGRGGMGIVYEAEQISLARRVALKILPNHLGFSPETIRKFEREAEAGGRQIHPGMVRIYAAGEHEGTHYIAQELVEGGDTLADRIEAINKEGNFPPGYFREAARCIADAADALNHAHESGVIHRDIKPSNILLTKEGQPKITDFGLAKLEDALALSRTGEFAGTPHYMSPEQVTSRKKGVDHRTDIYSLGVTLYEMITLRKPIEGHTSYDILKKIPTLDPLEPQKANPRVPRDLSIICLKAMEKQPEKRYHTMKEFAEDLKRFLNGEVILAKPAGPATRIMNRVKRYPLLSGAIGVALVATIGLILSILWYILQITRERDKVLRLSDIKVLADLLEEEKLLWPAYPQMIQTMKTWLKKAEELQGRYIIHSQTLDELRSTARVGIGTDGSEQNYIFDKIEDQWQHDALEELVSEMHGLFEEKSGLIQNVTNRLHFAENVRYESIEKHEKEWDFAIASIADEQLYPEYEGLVIEPIIGLIPIGQDPNSKLWEFAHLQTGKIPERGPENELIITEETGFVFVLIPGGTFIMGAQSEDPHGSNYDPQAEKNEYPPHEVSLQPFLISKYEMTQGQWLRFTKKNPSYFKPGTTYGGKEVDLLHPVEQVSWNDFFWSLVRLNLRLPTEAEWEYATRAGTDSVWWTGNEKESLKGSVNLCDLFCRKFGGQPYWSYETWLDDGYVVHAPVGTFHPNPFGLHDVCGNVWEWCHDDYTSSYMKTPMTDSQFKTAGPGQVIRGGGWGDDYKTCRSSCRGRGTRDSSDYLTGIRPAANLQ